MLVEFHRAFSEVENTRYICVHAIVEMETTTDNNTLVTYRGPNKQAKMFVAVGPVSDNVYRVNQARKKGG